MCAVVLEEHGGAFAVDDISCASCAGGGKPAHVG